MKVAALRTAVCVVSLLLVSRISGAQEPEQPRFDHITADDGLANSWVRDILRDRHGYMWFGTANGLDKYDGYSFIAYHHDEADPSSLAHNTVNALMEDSRGDLWVGTVGGLSRYDRFHDRFVGYAGGQPGTDSIARYSVHDVLESREGSLWFATIDGLTRFDPTTGRFERHTFVSPDPSVLQSMSSFGDILEDEAGHLWLASSLYGLQRFSPTTGIFERIELGSDARDPRPHNSVMGLALVGPKQLFVGTRGGGLYRLDPGDPGGTLERLHHDADDPRSLANDFVMCLLPGPAGDLWVGTENGGLDRLLVDEGRFVHNRRSPNDPGSLTSDSVYSLFADHSGNLWVGTWGGGVNVLFKTRQAMRLFRGTGAGGGLSHGIVSSFGEDRRGDLWIGTDGGGLNHYRRESNRFTNYTTDNSNLNRNAITALSIGPRDDVWLGTWAGGVSRFDRSSQSFSAVTAESGLLSDNILAILHDRRGHLWVACFATGLVELDENGRPLRSLRLSDGLHSEYVRTLVGLADGRILLGADQGFSIFDPEEGAFDSRLPEESRLQDRAVFCAAEGLRGELWLGTNDGLHRLDRQTGVLRRFGRREGLPSAVVNGIAIDQQGLVWVSTDRGIARVDPVDGQVKAYTVADGLQGNQYYIHSSLKTRAGEILFGGLNGFNLFRPEALEDNPEIPPVALTDFQIFNRSVPIGEGSPLRRHIAVADEVTLSHGDSVFSFEFSALSFVSPEANRYAYMMAGFDRGWVHSGARRTATYTNLPAGLYQFHVKASNNDGVWNQEGRSIRVVIRPPFWGTWWFRGLTGLAIVSLVLGAHQLRTRGIQRRARQLESEVNERRRVEVEREALLEEKERLLQEMAEKNLTLEAQNEELERFAYTVSHDLKAPIVTMKGFAGLLEQDLEAGRTKKVADSIERISLAADRMHRLLEDLLSLSRVGRVANAAEWVSLTELAQEAVGLLEAQIAQGSVAVQVQADMPRVLCDRVRLGEVFQNLLENSLKFRGEQPQPRVEVGAESDGAWVHCRVSDNGSGIDAEYQDKVFGLFERLGSAGEGSGVGLALAKRIIEVHGGHIWIQSAGAGQGTTVHFMMPAEETKPPLVAERPAG